MYLLLACTGSWLVLLGSFCTAWTQLPQPRTTSDLVVITVTGAAALAFSRLGLISLLALLLRILPSGRFRSLLARCVVRTMPRLLASSVLAVVSAGFVAQAAHSAPASSHGGIAAPPAVLSQAAAAPVDPGWPTVEEDSSVGAELHDPAWPTEPPPGSSSDSPTSDHREPADEAESGEPDVPERSDSHPERPASSPGVHVVEAGESLWSIAAELADSPADTPQLVDDVYAANRETIGPDPSLIIAGQRLEIQL